MADEMNNPCLYPLEHCSVSWLINQVSIDWYPYFLCQPSVRVTPICEVS